MTFNSVYFAFFFAIVFALVALLRRAVVARNIVLLAASYFFYGWWDWRFLLLLIASTIWDYSCGLLLRVDAESGIRPTRSGRDRAILIASIGVNLALLGFFKYYNFFADSTVTMLTKMGFHAHLQTLKVILPVGISFYTFQSMAYVIDVYRGDLQAERNPLHYATFVAFFPQLVAGPIVRPGILLPQIRQPNRITWNRICEGSALVGWGLFKKVVLADNVALVVDAVFKASHPQGGTAMLGIYAFAIQVYCDFSGYTDIARGVAEIMGFSLVRNFNQPYFATNPADFWQRWHISLSTWLRDYLYIPLGGNRWGNARTYVNLMLTMLLGGLWHGAAWTYVLWGAYHGALLCIHRALRPWMERTIRPRTPAGEKLWLVVRVVVFFHLVCFSYLLFRAGSVHQVGDMLRAIGTSLATLDQGIIVPQLKIILIACAITLLVAELAQVRARNVRELFLLPIPLRAVIYAAGILGFVIFGEYGGESFIYFQF